MGKQPKKDKRLIRSTLKTLDTRIAKIKYDLAQIIPDLEFKRDEIVCRLLQDYGV